MGVTLYNTKQTANEANLKNVNEIVPMGKLQILKIKTATTQARFDYFEPESKP